MNNQNNIYKIIGAAVVAAALLILGTGQNETISTDSTLQGYFATVTISGNGTPDNYIDVEGNGATIKCLRITGNYIRVSNVNVTGCSSHGVLIAGKNIIFENSNVYGNVTENGFGKCSGSGGWGSAVKVQVGGENVIIRGNTVYENCGEGIASTRGINITIDGNLVYDNFSVNIYIDNTRGAKVSWNDAKCKNPNYFRNNQPSGGIGLGAESYSGWGYQLQDVLIENNVMEGCKAIRLYEDTAIASGSPKNVVIQNNQFINSFQSVLVNVENAISINNVAVSQIPNTPTATISQAATYTATPTKTQNPFITPVFTVTKAPTQTSTPSITCIPAFNLWVCNGKP
jgi:hypothetical protein